MNQQQMMAQIARMQQQVQQAQAEIAAAVVTGTAGGGMVTVTASGDGEIRSVSISPDCVDRDDVAMLEDLVFAAMSDVQRAAAQLQADKMGPITGGLGTMGSGLGLGL